MYMDNTTINSPANIDKTNVPFSEWIDPTDDSIDFDEEGYWWCPIVTERAIGGLPCELIEPCWPNLGNFSGRGKNYHKFIFFSGYFGEGVLNSFKGFVDIAFYVKDILKMLSIEDTFGTTGPDDKDWTSSQRLVTASPECPLKEDVSDQNIFDNLDNILLQVKGDTEFQRSSELQAMAKEVYEKIREDKSDDIESWAERLSKKMSTLND